MHWKLKLFQTLSEALFPVLGYLFWSWTLFDISLFYLIDFLTLGVLFHIKLKKIEEFKGNKHNPFPFVFFQFFLFLMIIFLSYILFSKMIIDFNFLKEFKRFFLLKDMGLPQGYFLVPLIVYAAYLNFKMQFLSTKLYTKITPDSLKKQHLISLFISIATLVVLYIISQFFQIKTTPILILLILLTSSYSFIWKRV